MSETLLLKAKGLSTFGDSLSARPEGSLNVAENVVIDKPGLFSPRRGFEKLLGSFPRQATALIPFLDNILIYSVEADLTTYKLSLYNESTGTITDYSDFSSESRTIRTAEAAGNLFLAGDTGVVKLDSVAGSVVESGVPEALGGFGDVSGSTGFLTNGNKVGYRAIWGYKDANDNLILGAPCNQFVVVNGAGSARDVALTIQVPDEIVANKHFLQTYRTTQGTVDPSDEHQLFNEEFYVTYATKTCAPAGITTGTPGLITITSHGFVTGTPIKVTSSTTIPSGITSGLTYYVIKSDANSFWLATTAANAFTGTKITISSQGAGTHTFTHDGTIMTVLDQTPDALLGSGLYSNATREGSTQLNYQPPKCADLTVFNNHMFFADLTYKHSYSFQLLGTGVGGSTGGLVLGDTVTVAGVTYTAYSSEDYSQNRFAFYDTVDPAGDVKNTAQSLIRCINATHTTVYAYYDSLATDIPGKIRIELRDFSAAVGSAFTVLCTLNVLYPDRAPFTPDITSAKTSSAETFPNRLAWSKQGEYEAVPTPQYFAIGDKSKHILRVVALRDSVFIIKEEGIWRLTGTSSSNFTVDALDTTKLIAPGSVVVLNNLIYGWFDQGVCTLSESGVSILSRDIEGDLREIVGTSLASVNSYSFGVGYESDRKYLLWVPASSSTTYATKCYVYNVLTASWTTYTRSGKAAMVNPYNDRLYLMSGDLQTLSKERKNFSFRDFADEQVDATVSIVDEEDVTLSSLAGIEVGDLYYESDSKFATISSINTATNTITCSVDLGFSSSVSKTFTASGDTLTCANHYYATGLQVRFTTTGILPAGLSLATDYYVYKINANTFKICPTQSDAISGTNTITTTDAGTGTHTIDPQITPEVLTAYSSIVEWNGIHLNSSGHLKHFREAMFLMSKDFRSATASFKTNLSGSWSSVAFTGAPIGLWGLFPWGSLPWGGDLEVLTQHRTYTPRDKQRASVIYLKFNVTTAFSDWELSGVEMTYRDAGQRGERK
jgi:hypothetical protein